MSTGGASRGMCPERVFFLRLNFISFINQNDLKYEGIPVNRYCNIKLDTDILDFERSQ